MPWTQLLSYCFGGAFFGNAVPHFVSGVMGKPFQSPFAKPPGQGLSSPTINVLWGAFNIAVFYLLVCRGGDFDVKNAADAGAFGIGLLAIGLFAARHFGRLNGGNAPGRS
jgi:hypothetical protein